MASQPRAEDLVEQEAPRPIIVKKVVIEGGGGHHGGAWKVAYADFVTAMMAFFLMLWLLGATTEDQRKGIADHFTPTLVKLREGSAGSDGMLGGSSITDVDNYPNAAGQTGTEAITIPRDVTGGPREGAVDSNKTRRAEELKQRIDEKLEQSRRLHRLARQVRVRNTDKGVRIDLVDDADFSMFALGTTVLQPEARELLKLVAEVIAEGNEDITIRGHTDALPWRDGVTANNWSLSAGRAEATRQELMGDGISADRINRIEGVADREPLIEDDPADPRNRRMSITLVPNQPAPIRVIP